MLKLSAIETREKQKNNPYATWAARSIAANVDERHASNRLWKGRLNIGVRPKFTVAPSDKVFAMGSCFAREVEESLAACGFSVPTFCDHLFDHPLLSHPDREKASAQRLRPRSYLNRYNTMSLVEEVRHLLGLAPEIDAGRLIYQINEQAAADLHYSQALPQLPFAETLRRRALVRDYLAGEIRGCSLFILTLGLAEAWFDSVESRYLNNTPGPRVVAAYGDRLEIHLTTFRQHLEALERLYEILGRELQHEFKIVVTVSPVPLEMTFFDQDVITSNTYAKSMLRAVAHEFACGRDNVDYFPSYEIVNCSAVDESWVWDRRHVRPALVGHITGMFYRHYVDSHVP